MLRLPPSRWYLTGFLMEQPLAKLRSDMRRLGFERQNDVSEPEDHAAALCETMALLAGSDSSQLAVQAEFFEAHVGTWMARFFRLYKRSGDEPRNAVFPSHWKRKS